MGGTGYPEIQTHNKLKMQNKKVTHNHVPKSPSHLDLYCVQKKRCGQ